jgi:hypothetical protein
MDLQDERRWRVVERVIQPNSTQPGAIYLQVEASRESVEKQKMLMRVDDGVVVTESRLETPKHGGAADGENSENFAILLPASPAKRCSRRLGKASVVKIQKLQSVDR